MGILNDSAMYFFLESFENLPYMVAASDHSYSLKVFN